MQSIKRIRRQCFTRRRSGVRVPARPPSSLVSGPLNRPGFCAAASFGENILPDSTIRRWFAVYHHLTVQSPACQTGGHRPNRLRAPEATTPMSSRPVRRGPLQPVCDQAHELDRKDDRGSERRHEAEASATIAAPTVQNRNGCVNLEVTKEASLNREAPLKIILALAGFLFWRDLPLTLGWDFSL